SDAARWIGVRLPWAHSLVGAAIGASAVPTVAPSRWLLLPAVARFPGLSSPPPHPRRTALPGSGRPSGVSLPLVPTVDLPLGRPPSEILPDLVGPPLPPALEASHHLGIAGPAPLRTPTVSIASSCH